MTHRVRPPLRTSARAFSALACALLIWLTPLAGAAQPQSSPVPVPLVRVPFPQDDGTLTPYTFELGYPLVALMYDTLLWRDAAGVAQPWLAESVETSTDRRRITVRLPAGVQWQDGRPLTSADVAFTFAYVKRRPHPRFTPQVTAIDRVDAPDPQTAVFVLRTPSAGFLDQPLADVPILPAHLWRDVPNSALAPDGLPVGSGPYRLVAHDAGQRYRFEANEGYFKGRPAVTAIEVPIITDADGTFTALQRRRVDMVPVSLAPRGETSRIGTRVSSGPSYVATVLQFNLRRPPFDRLEVRQAVARALDVRRIASAVTEATAATAGYLHPESPWAPADGIPPAGGTTGGSDLRPFGLGAIEIVVADNDPVKLETARRVVNTLGNAGATASVRLLSREELSKAIGEDGAAPTFTAAVWSAPALPSYDPDFLRSLFGSTGPAGPLNYSGYDSAEFRALADRVATTTDAAARKAVVREELLRLAADAPAVPIFFATGNFAYRPSVFAGWVFVKGTGILDKRSFLEPAPAAPAMTAPSPPITPSDPDLSVAGWAGLVVAGLAVVVAVVGVLGRRR